MTVDLKVSVYQLDEFENVVDVRLERCLQRDGSELWAIREKGAVLDKEGDWQFEPLPSSRTDEFFEMCRFGSAEEALLFWRNGGHKSRFDAYRVRKDIA